MEFKYHIIVPINYLHINFEDSIQIEGKGELIHGSKLVPLLASNPIYLLELGHRTAGMYINNSWVFYLKFKSPTNLSHAQISAYLDNFISRCAAWIGKLWYHLDNNCFINKGFLLNQTEPSTLTVYREGIHSKANDEFHNTTLTKNDILRFEAFTKYVLLNALNPPNTEIKFVESTIGAVVYPVQMNFMKYDYNRLFRADNFITNARYTGIMISKITNYMSALECLFTTKSHDATITVTNRASHFIEGKPEEVARYAKDIKTAYNIRSRFLHGDKIKMLPEDIKDLCIEIDGHMRKIMNKAVLNIPENNVFHITETEGGKKRFEKQFNDFGKLCPTSNL